MKIIKTILLEIRDCTPVIALILACVMIGCATHDKSAMESHDEAIKRTMRENDAYSRGYKDGQDRAIIDLMNKEGRTWERYLRQ